MSEQGPHIFFSPHADDVVLSCGGAIHSLISQGTSVEVIGVFAATPNGRYSAYARYLHAKWRLGINPIEERWREDTAAMNELGLGNFERWDYPEAPYRTQADGSTVYSANEELTGEISIEDGALRDAIAHRVREHLERLPDTAVSYFPLSLGNHVDHRILFEIGLKVRAAGKQVRFYEDYPYNAAYKVNGHNEWCSEVVAIALEPKTRAARAYASQVHGLGGSVSVFEKRLAASAAAVGNGRGGERYWEIEACAAKKIIEVKNYAGHPLVRKDGEFKLRDFAKFLKGFRWHDLEEILPVGSGYCLDLGCGPGRHRSLIESKGYQWFGFDRSAAAAGVRCDATALPVCSQSQAAVVGWQILEYVERPEEVFAEAVRVLETGGVFCGSVSFLEPVHGRTYYNFSPLIMETLLRRHGFTDIEIKPGLNGFALMLWTWLRRLPIPLADRLAIPIAFMLLAPPATLVFLSSWFRLRLGLGDGHAMRWLSETAPLEFAGHVMFTARKRSWTSAASRSR